jgi:hypothetical protein
MVRKCKVYASKCIFGFSENNFLIPFWHFVRLVTKYEKIAALTDI